MTSLHTQLHVQCCVDIFGSVGWTASIVVMLPAACMQESVLLLYCSKWIFCGCCQKVVISSYEPCDVPHESLQPCTLLVSMPEQVEVWLVYGGGDLGMYCACTEL